MAPVARCTPSTTARAADCITSSIVLPPRPDSSEISISARICYSWRALASASMNSTISGCNADNAIRRPAIA